MEDSDTLKEALLRLTAKSATNADIEIVQRALQNGQITLATGERAVAFGGDVTDSLIVTGDGNTIHVFQGVAHFGVVPPLLFTVPSLPLSFVERREETQALLALLLDNDPENSTSVIISLQGCGGFGKTILAQAVCYTKDIRNTFSDGVLWVTLGEHPNVLNLLLDQIEYLSGHRPGLTDINVAATRLEELIAERKILLVLDDVWREIDIVQFLRLGKNRAKLLTTRRQDIAVGIKAKVIDIGEMQVAESMELLLKWLDDAPEDLTLFEILACELGKWPLLLSLAGAYIRETVIVDKLPLSEAIGDLRKRLLARGFTVLDRPDEQQRNKAVSISLEVSLERLGQWRERYAELSIFPMDIDIPFRTIEQLWSASASMDSFSTEDALKAMRRLSLFVQFDLTQKVLRLHDVVQKYLASQLPDVSGLHKKLLDSWGDLYALPTLYAWQYYVYHLQKGGRNTVLRKILLDFHWIEAKLSATDINSLITDYKAISDDGTDTSRMIMLVSRSLEMSSHILSRSKDQLWHQLYGRLGQSDNPLPITLPPKPNLEQYLLPLKPNLQSPESPLLHTIVGHWGTVIELVITRGGRRIISTSHDRTIRVWDIETGKELKRLIGHTDSVPAIRLTPDERYIVSGAGAGLGTWSDNSIRIWEIETEQNILTVSGNEERLGVFIVSSDESYHHEPIGGLAISPDGEYIVSASWDQTIKIWRIRDGVLMRTLAGHEQGLNTVIITPDGESIISGASDGKIKIWDFDTGREIRTIDAHGYDYVLSIELFPDGKRLVSSSSGGEVKIWDVQTGQELLSLEWHKSDVQCVTISPDGRYIASGSSDNVICVWDSIKGVPIYQIRDEYSINSVRFTTDERLIAASGNRIRVWDVSDLNRLRQLSHQAIGHDAPIIQTAILKKLGLAITLDEIGSAKLWDLATGTTVRTLENFGAAFVNCDNGRLISVAENYIKIWNTSTWQPSQTFTTSIGYKYHVQKIEGIEVTSDNLLVVCVRSAEWMSIRSFNLVSGELIYSGNFGYEDHEWEIFRIMAGFGEPVAYEVHDISSGKMIITPDEGHAIFYFNFIKTIMGVNIRSKAQQGINFLPIIGKRMEWNLEMPSAELIKAGFEREIFGDHGKLIPGVQDIAVTRDGRYLLVALTHGFLLKWDLQISAPPTNFAGHERSVKFVRALKDGERVLSISDDGTIKIWHLNSGQCEQTLTGFTFSINHIALSDDDSYLGISSRDFALLVWNLSTGQLITKFYGESDIDSFDFSPAGEFVLVGERSGRVHILRLEHQ